MGNEYDDVKDGPVREAVDAEHRVDQVVTDHPEEFKDSAGPDKVVEKVTYEKTVKNEEDV